MNTQESEKLLNLLNRLHPRAQKKPTRDEVLFWREVLKPWDYPTVREAAITRARSNRFYPDPTELAALLPPQSAESTGSTRYEDPEAQEYFRKTDRMLDAMEREFGPEKWAEYQACDTAGKMAAFEKRYSFDLLDWMSDYGLTAPAYRREVKGA